MNTFKARLLSILVLVCLLTSFPGLDVRAQGSIIYVKHNATGLNNGTSWANAYKKLQLALRAAPQGAEIWVAKGVYKPTTSDRSASFRLKNGVALYGGFAGTETSRSQRDPRLNVTTLSGDIGQANDMNDNSYHVIMSEVTDPTTILDGFTVEYGNANSGSVAANLFGGGMYNSGNPTLRNITFSNNFAFSGGGGMYNLGNPTLKNVTFYMNTSLNEGAGMYNSSSTSTLKTVTFSNNSASGQGGGMYSTASDLTLTHVTFENNFGGSSGGGMFNTSSQLLLSDVKFDNNTTDGGGGGMYNTASPSTLTDVAFNSNSAFHGGGMYNCSNSTSALTDVTFNGNTAGYYGGGMYNCDGGSTLTDVMFSGNTASEGGGGMFNGDSGALLNVTFSNNSARGGGGMTNSGDGVLTNVTFVDNIANELGGGMINTSGGRPTLTNVTFSGNTADEAGGMQNAGIPTLINVTFTENIASSSGGGFRNDGRPTLHNTILWGNTAPNGSQIYDNGGQGCNPVTISDSVIQGGCSAGSVCTNIITADPLLGTLGDYGGSTQTIPLNAGSSAIDTGDDAVCPATDQRGVTRPQGSRCDLGAYEAVPNRVDAGTYNDAELDGGMD